MRLLTLVVFSGALWAVTPFAFGQAPVIQNGAVASAASNISLTNVAPQMLIAIKGKNLALSTEAASSYPLPDTLGGATVTISGKAIPLLYASPEQINAQVPTNTGSSVDLVFVVTTAAGASQPYTLPVEQMALGIFTQNSTGCGPAVAFNIHTDGRPLSLNTPENSLDPDKDFGLAIFLTGLGGVNDRTDGIPYTYAPWDNQAGQNGVYAYLGSPLTGLVSLSLQYAGPEPDTVGVDQVNAAIGPSPTGPALQGCHVPLFLQSAFGQGVSQLVSVSIQPGGGACVDPPHQTLGIVTWEQTVTGGKTSAAITANFLQANGLGFPAPSTIGSLQDPFTDLTPAPPVAPGCAVSVPATLDAGELTLTGPGVGSMSLKPSIQNGRITYQAVPPSGTIEGGTYTLTGQGGGQVGAFTASGHIPAPIAITTDLSGAMQAVGNSYVVNWTGGDDESVVTMILTIDDQQFFGVAPGSAGSVSIEAYVPIPCFFGFLPGQICGWVQAVPDGTGTIAIVQASPLSPSLPFSAPRLALGGELTWKYTFEFPGIDFTGDSELEPVK